MTLAYTPVYADPATIDALNQKIIERTRYGLDAEVHKGDYDGDATIFYTDRWGNEYSQDHATLTDLLDDYAFLDHHDYYINLIVLPDNIAAELHPQLAAA